MPGVKIFRFESAVFYANSEYFRSSLIELTGIDPQNPINKHSSIGSDSSVYYRGNASDPASPSIEITGPSFPDSSVSVNSTLENGVSNTNIMSLIFGRAS